MRPVKSDSISYATPDQHERFPEGVGFPATSLTLEIIGPDGGQVAPGEIGQIRVRKVGMFNDYVAALGGQFQFPRGVVLSARSCVLSMPGEPLILDGGCRRCHDPERHHEFPHQPSRILWRATPMSKRRSPMRSNRAFTVRFWRPPSVLNDAAEAGLASDLLNHCRQALGIRAPRQIIVLDRIPRNAAGKPLRRELSGS